MQYIQEQIATFSPISLKEMDSVALMKRTDTKFLIAKNKIPSVLAEIKEVYQVLEIDKNRLMTYASRYFDTENKSFYYAHHNGKINRIKIRIRQYIESKLTFLEVKQKDAKGNTTKSRIKMNDFEAKLSSKSIQFIKNITDNHFALGTSLSNEFNRITLVNIKNKERVTVDLNLSYVSGSEKKSYQNLAIVEVKQERVNRNSAIVKVLRKHRIFPYNVSKYCIGMISLYEGLKYNRFKPKLLKINKLIA